MPEYPGLIVLPLFAEYTINRLVLDLICLVEQHLRDRLCLKCCVGGEPVREDVLLLAVSVCIRRGGGVAGCMPEPQSFAE